MAGLIITVKLNQQPRSSALTVGKKDMTLNETRHKKDMITFHIAGSCDHIHKNQRCMKCFKILNITKDGKSKFKAGTIICEIKSLKTKKSRFKKQMQMNKEAFSQAVPCWMYEQN